MTHRLAMIDGYQGPFGGFDANAPADVEATIRAQIATMQKIQSTLWSAVNQWSRNQFLIGLAIPAVRLLQIGKYNWRDAVNQWQSSLDTWWSNDLTNTVRQNPDRLQSWVDMGARINRTATQIAKEMGDDGVVKIFTDYGKSLGIVVRGAGGAAAGAVGAIIPWWVWAVAVGGGVLYISTFLPRSRR